MKNTFLLLATFLLSQAVFGQNMDWVSLLGGEDGQSINALTVDPLGNIYLTGSFSGTTDFDPSSSTYNLTTTGLTDVYIAKYDSIGGFLWAKKMGGLYWDYAQDISLDNEGNILITGAYRNTCDFDPGSGTAYVTSNGWYSVFIAKYDSDGNYIWVHGVGGSYNDIGNSIRSDANGNVYVGGFYNLSVDFDPSENDHVLISNGSNEAFIAKYDSSGVFQWAHSFGGETYDLVNAMAIDANENVYITGHFTGDVDFDPSPDSAYLESEGINSDFYLAKFDSLGLYQWAFKVGWMDGESALAMDIDSDNNLVITGRMGDTGGPIDFDPGPDSAFLETENAWDAFVAKYDENANYIWAKRIGGNNWVEGTSIKCSDNGNILLSGNFKDTVDLDPGFGEVKEVSEGDYDFFIVQLDVNGNYIWSKKYGSVGWDECNSVSLTPNGNLLAGGFFSASIDFDVNDSVQTYNAVGGADSFLAHFTIPCFTSYEHVLICAGQSFTFPDGSSSDTSMLYTENHLSIDGCDSLIYIDLTIVNSYFSQENITICEGESYVFPDGTSSDTSIIYVSNLISTFGCDSLVETNLTVFENQTHEENVSICEGDVYVFPDGSLSDSSLVHTSFLSTVLGCDSIIISSLSVHQLDSTSESIQICQGDTYTLPNGNTIDTSGVYISHLLNSNNCDSVVISEVNMIAFSNEVYISDNEIFSVQAAGFFQWLDCNNNMQVIEGETEPSFNPSENGSYAVEIHLLDCITISECVEVNWTSLNEEVQFDPRELVVKRNGDYWVTHPDVEQIAFYSIEGKLIKERMLNFSEELMLETSELENGIYILMISMKNKAVFSQKMSLFR